MIDKRRAQRLIGESIRDIGILVAVFGPLDAFVQKERPSAVVVIAIAAAGLLFIALGIYLAADE